MSDPALLSIQQALASIADRLGSIETKIGLESSTEAGDGPALLPPAVSAFDKHVASTLPSLLSAIATIGNSEISAAGGIIENCWACMRVVVAVAASSGKPSPADRNAVLSELLKASGLAGATAGLQKLGRDRDASSHIKAVGEAMGCISWLTLDGPSAEFVKSAADGSEYWSNRVLKDNRGKKGRLAHIAFCANLGNLVKELSIYVKKSHTTGLAWKMGGAPPLSKENVEAAVATARGKGTKDAAAPTAPAPAPAAAAATSSSPKKKGMVNSGLNALKSALEAKRTNTGESAASGLKKVTRDQQSWRKEYKQDGGSAPVPTSLPRPTAKAAVASSKPAPPSKCEYHAPSQKWLVEHQVSSTNNPMVLTVDVTDQKQQVYMYKCTNVTVVITGKAKTIVMDTCTKCNLIFDTVVASFEVVNGKRCKVQVKGVCPSIAIDKTDGCQVYLSKETMSKTKFVTSKSSEMNVNWPDTSGDMKEAPIPEQFQHILNPKNGTISSEVSELYH